MNNNQKGILFAIITVLFWSTVATAFKINLKYFDIYNMLFYSSLTSFLVFFIIKLFQEGKKLLEIEKKIYKSIIYGFLNPFLYYLVLFYAYNSLPAQIALPLNYTWVIILSLLSLFILKQKIKLYNFLGLIISFLGIIIISKSNKINVDFYINELGIFAAILSAFIWGIYWILNLKDSRKTIDKLFYNFLFGTIFSLILLLVRSKFNFSFIGILSSIYVGIFEMGLTFFTWMLALKYSDNSAKVGNLIYLSPVLSLIFISIILKEEILLTTIIGLILILIGIFIQKIKN